MNLSEKMCEKLNAYHRTGDVEHLAELSLLFPEVAQLEAYCDKLAEGLPEGMLPKDIELINETNVKLLVEIEQLRGENSALRANTSKSVLRRLKAQGTLGSECD